MWFISKDNAQHPGFATGPSLEQLEDRLLLSVTQHLPETPAIVDPDGANWAVGYVGTVDDFHTSDDGALWFDRETFGNTDYNAYGALHFDYIDTALEVRAQFIDPAGQAWQEPIYVDIPSPATQDYEYWDWYFCWFYAPIEGYTDTWTPGEHSIEFSIREDGDWQTIATETFTYVDAPAAVDDTPYYVYDEFGGSWIDTDKQDPTDPDATPPGTGDDYLCWAATAANALEWTGWATADQLGGAASIAQGAFDYYQDHWSDEPSYFEPTLQWWFDGIDHYDQDLITTPGGGFWPEVDFDVVYESEYRLRDVVHEAIYDLHQGKSVTLGLTPTNSYDYGHLVSLWGYARDGEDFTLWITDSDDGQTGLTAVTAKYDWYDRCWYLLGYDGDYQWYIDASFALNAPAGPTISELTGDMTATTGVAAQFSASAEDPDDADLTYTWDFGDGSAPTSGENLTSVGHVYLTEGPYTVTLTVQDSTGLTDASQWIVNVGAFGSTEAVVLGRHVFYNGSAYPAPEPTIRPLLPGESPSTDNGSVFGRGINGLMIDMEGLAAPAAISTADFVFEVNTAEAPDTWILAPVPASISIDHHGGDDGSDRIMVTWADNAIANQWLRVTVLPTAATGLAQPDTFSVSHLAADLDGSGNVDLEDFVLFREGFSSPTPSVAAGDLDGNGTIDLADFVLLRNNFGTALPAHPAEAPTVDLLQLASQSPPSPTPIITEAVRRPRGLA